MARDPTSQGQHENPPVACHADLRRRDEIRRSLYRANTSIVVVLCTVVALATVGFWKARQALRSAEAERIAREAAFRASQEKQEQLWRSQLLEARSHRISGTPGQRLRSLEVIRQAAAWKPSLDLRNEALAALMLPDIGATLSWRAVDLGRPRFAYDAELEHYVTQEAGSLVRVRRSDDHVVVKEFPGLGSESAWTQFSADGALFAAQYSNNRLGVWDWRNGRLLWQVTSRFVNAPAPGFDFTPDGAELAVCSLDGPLRRFNSRTGEERVPWVAGVKAEAVRLSPGGRRAATMFQGEISVWNLDEQKRVARTRAANRITALAWHPDESLIAIGSVQAGVSIWDVSEASPLRLTGPRDNATITDVQFNQHGDLLIASGWGEVTEIWDLERGRLLLRSPDGYAVALSRDGERLAFGRERLGYGIWRFHPPVGLRKSIIPAALGTHARCLAFHPDGQWLATGHEKGWALWDVARNRRAAERRTQVVHSIHFAAQGRSAITCGRDGIQLWAVTTNDAGERLAPGEPRMLYRPEGGHLNEAALSPDETRIVAAGVGTPSVVVPVHGAGAVMRLDQHAYDLHRIRFTPDGAWLVAGHHHDRGVHVFNATNGQPVGTLETGTGVFSFPGEGEWLLSRDSEHYSFWRIGQWRMERRVPGIRSSLAWGLAGFTPHDKTLFLVENAERFHLREWSSDVDFATLAPPSGGGYFSLTQQPLTGRLSALANSRAVTSLDMAALRRELAALGLDWPEENRATCFVPSITDRTQSRSTNGDLALRGHAAAIPHGWLPLGAGGWTALGGVLAAIGLGTFLLRYQRVMVRRYIEAEETIRRREAEVEQARQEGLQGQKMQALGLLAGGVSHEFKNLLSTISLSNDLIRRELGPGSAVGEEVDNIDHAVEQGRAVVNSLLGYSRPRDAEAPACDPVRVIQSTLKLLNREFLGRTAVVFQPPPRPLCLGINGARLEQILVNLCTNAVEAMERDGELRIELREGVVAEHDAVWVLRAPSAERAVTLSVADTGCGMERAIVERIFEPFFTTKGGNETPLVTIDASSSVRRGGSGLGLTTVYRLAEKAGAGLAVWSRVGCGSVFCLVLPAEENLGATRPVGETGAP